MQIKLHCSNVPQIPIHTTENLHRSRGQFLLDINIYFDIQTDRGKVCN